MVEYRHKPVLLNEVLQTLNPRSGKIYVDCTLGGGGHAEAILRKIKPQGLLIGIDCDEEALEVSKKRLKPYNNLATLLLGNFRDIRKLVLDQKVRGVDGILFDLGVSSYQIDEAKRGFSLRLDGPLDMRMSLSQRVTAADLINSLDQDKLIKIIKEYGEERFARRIAKAIIKFRTIKPITRTLELADIIREAIPRKSEKEKFGSVTRAFQAVRIAVNDELNNLKIALNQAIELLKSGGRLAAISYHSLEDRIVKSMFKLESSECICPPKTPICICGHRKKIKILTRKPITPTYHEISVNPRARSAKLRVAEKL